MGPARAIAEVPRAWFAFLQPDKTIDLVREVLERTE